MLYLHLHLGNGNKRKGSDRLADQSNMRGKLLLVKRNASFRKRLAQAVYIGKQLGIIIESNPP